MKCVILQPSYIPWRGYFHQIQMADVFIFYDDVQYDKHGWRNRNRIKTQHGSQWLTIPVQSKGCVEDGLLINAVRVSSPNDWAEKHARSIRQSYGRAPHFSEIWEQVQPHFSRSHDLLADITIDLTLTLSKILGLGGRTFLRSSDLQLNGSKSDRLLEALKQVGATHYISGPSAQSYLDVNLLLEAGITTEFMTYNYPEYPQLHGPFDPQVSILDLLFMMGTRSGEYIWGPSLEPTL